MVVDLGGGRGLGLETKLLFTEGSKGGNEFVGILFGTVLTSFFNGNELKVKKGRRDFCDFSWPPAMQVPSKLQNTRNP